VLKKIANCLFVDARRSTNEVLTNLYKEFWGISDGEKLVREYFVAEKYIKSNNGVRSSCLKSRFKKIDSMITNLEIEMGIKT